MCTAPLIDCWPVQGPRREHFPSGSAANGSRIVRMGISRES